MPSPTADHSTQITIALTTSGPTDARLTEIAVPWARSSTDDTMATVADAASANPTAAMPNTTAFAATTRRRFGSESSVGTIEPYRASSVYDRIPSTTTKIGTITIISANPGSVVSSVLGPKCIVATIAHAATPASATAPPSSP